MLDDAQLRGGGAGDLGDAPCPAVGSPIEIKYFADDPVKASPLWSNEYAPRLHLVLGGVAGVLGPITAAMYSPELPSRAARR